MTGGAHPTFHAGFSSTNYEPVADRFYGYRAFEITEESEIPAGTLTRTGGTHGPKVRGSLTGVFKREWQWGPGVNHAACLRPASNHPTVAGKQHHLMMPDCDCGFWAYTNGDHYLSVRGPAVLGIIEAWGRMVIGPDGFRAQHARIVALAFPKSKADKGDVGVDAASSVLTDALAPCFAALRGFGIALAQATARVTGSPPPTPKPVTVERVKRPWEDVDRDLQAAVRRLYPDTAVFDSIRLMQRAYPLTDLSALLPEPEQEASDA